MAQLNELKRMQQLAGLITESQLNENNFFGFSYKNKNKDIDTKKLMAMDEKEAFQIARKWMEKNNLDPNEIQSMKQLDQYEIEKYDEITEAEIPQAGKVVTITFSDNGNHTLTGTLSPDESKITYTDYKTDGRLTSYKELFDKIKGKPTHFEMGGKGQFFLPDLGDMSGIIKDESGKQLNEAEIPQQESIEQVVNEALRKFRKQK